MRLYKVCTAIVFFYIAPAFATETLTVAVASSLYLMLERQSLSFEQSHAVHLKLVAGSTGRLYNQIQHGAPFDVFIAANEKYPDLLLHHGKITVKYMLGYGYLGLMINHQHTQDLQQLTRIDIQHIVIANPDVAPFGQATKKLLLQKKLWKVLKPKLVYAQNAMQASMMVKQGLVEAGFIPVLKKDGYLTRIPYIGVSLSARPLNKTYLQSQTTQP